MLNQTVKFLSLLLCLSAIGGLQAQDFYQQSFETEAGWALSHSFDSGNDYCKRDSAATLDELGYTLFGYDADFVIAIEDTDGVLDESPEDGVVTLTIDPVDITGQTDIEVLIGLSCFASESAYDDRSQDNGDYLDLQASVDGGTWETIAQFNSAAGGSSISGLYHDIDMDGDGGELGELPVNETMSSFVIALGQTGASVQLRMMIKSDGGDEVIVVDDLRLRESPGDDQAPTVYSATVLDANTIEIVYQEAMGPSAGMIGFYSGIADLASANLQADNQTVLLDYATDFVIGDAYQLAIFGVQDMAGNSMAGIFTFPFYLNPTTPELVITEVMYNDPSQEDSLEFIEIYNQGLVDAVVGGFRIEGAVSHTLASVTLTPGEFYLVARNSAAATAYYGIEFQDYGGQLSDNSEEILLVNADGVTLDVVEYNDNVPWPTAADGTGPSMELISPDLDNAIGSNWFASTSDIGFIDGLVLAATPGALGTLTVPVIQFDNNDLIVNEIDGLFELDFYITGANSQASEVSMEIIAGTATATVDHGIDAMSDLSLPGNSPGVESVAYPLVNDAIDEDVEYFTLRLTAVSNCSIGVNDEITIIILDDDASIPTLYINELMSSNQTSIADPAGDQDDWFEVYNPGPADVDLAGYLISDDPGDISLDRFAIGSGLTVVPAGGYAIFWADDEAEQGADHLSFKLSSGGESIVLTDPTGMTTVDAVDFGAITADASLSRICDGEDNWLETETSTPGSSNCPDALAEHVRSLQVYPNPSSDWIQLSAVYEYTLSDLTGRTVLQGRSSRINLSQLEAGQYILHTLDGGVAQVIKQ